MLMSGVGFHSNIDWKEERKTEWEIPVMHCLQSMVIGNTENKAHNFWDMQPLWCKQYITLMHCSITNILNLSQHGMDLINEWLAASHFHFPPTCKLKISSCSLSHCEYSRWHRVKRNFQFYTRQQLRENLGFLFFWVYKQMHSCHSKSHWRHPSNAISLKLFPWTGVQWYSFFRCLSNVCYKKHRAIASCLYSENAMRLDVILSIFSCKVHKCVIKDAQSILMFLFTE